LLAYISTYIVIISQNYSVISLQIKYFPNN